MKAHCRQLWFSSLFFMRVQLWPSNFKPTSLPKLLLGRNAMTNLDSVLKSRDITLPTKVRIVKAMVFPVSCMAMRAGL